MAIVTLRAVEYAAKPSSTAAVPGAVLAAPSSPSDGSAVAGVGAGREVFPVS